MMHDVFVDINGVSTAGEYMLEQVPRVFDYVAMLVHVAIEQNAVFLCVPDLCHRELDVALLVPALCANHWRGELKLAGNVVGVQRDFSGEKPVFLDNREILEDAVNTFEQVRTHPGNKTLSIEDKNLLHKGKPELTAAGVFLRG